jgi:two-component system nitrogen regulation sensor histidine kinase NtrY
MDKVKLKIILRTLILFLLMSAAALLFILEMFVYLLLLVPLTGYLLYFIYKSQLMLYKETEELTMALHYRDFSRKFNSDSSHELRPLYINFNRIIELFQQTSREKETQYQYLQQILELVNTGILSFEESSGEVIWMNSSLKQMLDLPYIRTIHSLSKRDIFLYEDILSLRPGESRIAAISTNRIVSRIFLSATAFQTNGKKYRLIAFQNINEVLDETESRAWHTLLSVLTHEIMNSIAPISSLADTIKNRLEDLDKKTEASIDLTDLKLGVDTIKKRSEGLLKFAETYRNLNKITKLNRQKLYLRDLFENLHSLMQPTLEKKGINLDIILKDHNLMLEADPTLIEQVMINLMLNAIDAVKNRENPQLTLHADVLDGKVQISVGDNGTGIEKEMLDKIFVPFFSTRKNGNGIGLTLCKQIMMLHNGSIRVRSEIAEGTSFILKF